MDIPHSIDSMLMVVVVDNQGKETLGMIATPGGIVPLAAFTEESENYVRRVARDYAKAKQCLVRTLRFVSPDTEEIFDGRRLM